MAELMLASFSSKTSGLHKLKHKMTKSADYLQFLNISYGQILLGNSTTFEACEAQVNKFEQIQVKSHGDTHVATMTKISTVSVFNTVFLKQVFPVFEIDTIFCM